MATTANTTLPATPFGGQGGTRANAVFQFQAFDTGVAAGDVVIFNTEAVDEDNSAPADNTVVGIALEDEGTADALVSVAPAFPGALFEMNMCDGATDEVGVANTHLGIVRSIVESADGYACFDFDSGAATANDVVLSLWFAGRQVDPQTNTDAGPYTAGVGVTNPRMIVTFVNSVWHRDA